MSWSHELRIDKRRDPIPTLAPLALPLKVRERSYFSHAVHFLIAPNVTPRNRCLRSRNVNTATGSRNKTVPAAIAVQSVIPEPSCEGMNGGAVCARRFVIINANAYSFHAVMKQNTAV